MTSDDGVAEWLRRKSKDLSKDLAQDRPGSIPAQGRKIYIKMLLHRLH